MAIGRPPSTNREQIAAVALGLFERDGFEETTVEDIAAAVGVERRTIFRYFPSKNDIVWGDFEWVIERLRSHLEEAEESLPLMDALRRAAVLSNSYPEDQLPELRIRMTLITTAPALQANSMLRYAAWRQAIAEWSARRLGLEPGDLIPGTVAHLALGASMAGFARWVANPGEDLERCLDESYRVLAEGLPGSPPPGAR